MNARDSTKLVEFIHYLFLFRSYSVSLQEPNTHVFGINYDFHDDMFTNITNLATIQF